MTDRAHLGAAPAPAGEGPAGEGPAPAGKDTAMAYRGVLGTSDGAPGASDRVIAAA